MKKNLNISVLVLSGLMIMQTEHSLLIAKEVKKPEVTEKKTLKIDPKLEPVERIRLVLKFGNTAQVRESLQKMTSLSEADQKSLIPELTLLLNTKDSSLQISMIQIIGEVKWNDFDSKVPAFLESQDTQIVTAAANVIRKKNIREGLEPLKVKIQKADYTIQDNNLNDLLNAYSGLNDSSLQSFLFEKLRHPDVLTTYKTFILKYLGNLAGNQIEIINYLLDLVNNNKTDPGLRIYAVRTLANMQHEPAKETFRKILSEIDSLNDLAQKREMFNLRLELISALVKLKDEDVKILLIQMTRDDDELVRIRAIRRLADFKSQEFKDLLEYKLKYDSSLAVQKEARKALEILNGKNNDTGNEENP